MKRKINATRMNRHTGTVSGPPPRGRGIARIVRAIIRKRVEEGCEQACSELASGFGVGPLFPNRDPASLSARRGIRATIDDVTRELTKLVLTALLFRPVARAWPPPGAGPAGRPRLYVVGAGSRVPHA